MTSKAVVAFMDILGFREMIEENKLEDISKLYDTKLTPKVESLNKIREINEGLIDLFPEIHVLQVSDSIILWIPEISEYSIFCLVSSVRELMVNFLRRGVPLRGGISIVSREKSSLLEALPHFEWSSPSAVYVGYGSGRVSGSTLKKEIFFYEQDKRVWELFTTDPTHFRKYNELGRNDGCGCGSGKKFKSCCYEDFEEVKRIWRTISDKHLATKVGVHPEAQVEESIFSF
jgi:SEC-C motif